MSFLGKPRDGEVKCRFCGGRDGDGHLFRDCTFLPLQHVREQDPWAACLGQLADRSLEQALGAYPVDCSGFWTPPDIGDSEDMVIEIGAHPCLWTDGSLES